LKKKAVDDMEKKNKVPLRLKIAQIPELLVANISSWLGAWQGWVHIVLAFLVLEIAVFSIEQARWISPQPLLSLILFVSFFVASLFTLSRLPRALVHILIIVIGIVVTMAQSLVLLPESASGLTGLFNLIQTWWQASRKMLPGEESMVFIVFITFLTWVIGYLTAWFILKKNNAWMAISLGLVVIIVNLSNLPDKYYFFFPLFFIVTALLMMQIRTTRQSSKTGSRTVFAGRNILYPVISLVCIIVVAASISWAVPQVRATGLQNTISTRISLAREIRDSKINIFNTVPSKQSRSTISTRQDLQFEGTWHEDDRVDFTVKSDRPSYWRVFAYDTYTRQGWESSQENESLLEQNQAVTDDQNAAEQNVTKYTVTAGMRTDIVLVSGDFVSSDMPAIVHRNAENEITAVTATRVLAPGESYTVKAVLPVPGISELAGAGVNYPADITDKYLQLPPDFPEKVRQLSESITGGAKTPYEKVTAINKYLEQFPYSKDITPQPEGADAVEYFLFTQKSGFCLYFASAMTVMLRSVDVPARLVVGYLPGDPGENAGEYLLRDKYYHAWPQVYFPGYGWVDLEATPGGAGSPVAVNTPLVSEGNVAGQPQWDAWQQYLPYWLNNLPASGAQASGPAPQKFKSRALPFADELGRALLIISGSIVLIFVLLSPLLALRAAFYRWLWHVDRTALASRTYEKLCRLAALVKLGPRPQQTPLEFAAELAVVFPQEAKDLDHIAQAYVENRFGRRESKMGLFEEAEILKARYRVYDALLQRLGITRTIFRKKR
jgi:transglutaminase-like putative cysteine protease